MNFLCIFKNIFPLTSVRELVSLYVDTTFCMPEAYHIPSRKECVDATVGLISPWMAHSPYHIVALSCPARWGHEHLLVELARQLNTKVGIWVLLNKLLWYPYYILKVLNCVKLCLDLYLCRTVIVIPFCNYKVNIRLSPPEYSILAV